MIYSATLKSAGDTIWVMRTTIIVNWIMLAGELILIKLMTVSPIHAWLFFVVCMASIPVLMFFRYLKGQWLHIKMIN
jgi:Na+-driven multidrug efflux pump